MSIEEKTEETAETMSGRRRWLILVAIGSFNFMATLVASIVNIALPTLSRELRVPMDHVTWIVLIYLIAVSGLLIFFGRLGDLIGKIRVFRAGTVIFTLGSLLAGFDFGFWFLIFARFVQAWGAAMTMSNSFGIITSVFPPRNRTRAMAAIGIFVSLGAVTGPGLGGLILQFLPWGYIFWINVPAGLFAIVMGAKLFPKSKPLAGIQLRNLRHDLDWTGAALFFCAISFLFLGVEIGQNKGFIHSAVIGFVVGAIMLGISFIVVEFRLCGKLDAGQKSVPPLIDLHIFRNRLFSISLIAGLFMFTTNFFANIIMPFYLQNLRGWTPGHAGLVMMAFPITMIIVGPIAGWMGDYANKEIITAVGITLVAISQFAYTLLDERTSIFALVAVTVLNAGGTAIFQSPNNALVMSTVEKRYLGVAGSINALARNLGMVTGISLATVALFTTMSARLGQRVIHYVEDRPDAFLSGMHTSFYISFGLSLVTLCVVGLRLFFQCYSRSYSKDSSRRIFSDY
ncbi:MAG: MFS transporter [Acidobacteriota bacterium]|jgi:EmrB/QacA subfamily drug resistance transporter|nr:MFS transporter [Acidobacteriota bacterium]